MIHTQVPFQYLAASAVGQFMKYAHQLLTNLAVQNLFSGISESTLYDTYTPRPYDLNFVIAS